MSGDNNGWGEYSKMVLKELEVLSQGMASLKQDMEGLRREMAELRAKEDRVKELVDWKRRIDDVASPLQLRELQKEESRLNQQLGEKRRTKTPLDNLDKETKFISIKLKKSIINKLN